MRVEREAGGVVVAGERWTLLRMTCLAGATAIAALVVWCPGTSCRGRDLAGGLVAAALFGLIGALVADVEYRFDPRTRQVTWRRWRLVRARTGRVAFDDVLDILVRSETDTDTDGRRRTVWRLDLVTRTGPLPLSSQRATRADEYEATAELLRLVVGLPAPRPEDGVARLARGGYLIEAVALARNQLGLDPDDATALVDRLRHQEPRPARTTPRSRTS